jgi:hypothetical protein
MGSAKSLGHWELPVIDDCLNRLCGPGWLVDNPDDIRVCQPTFAAEGLSDVIIIPTPLVSYSLSNMNKLLRLDIVAKAAGRGGLITKRDSQRWFAELRQR